MDSCDLIKLGWDSRLTKETLKLALQCFVVFAKIMANPISFSGIDLLFAISSFSKTNYNEVQQLQLVKKFLR